MLPSDVGAVVTDPTKFVEGVGEALENLSVDDATIEALLTILGSGEEQVPTEVAPLRHNLFGTLPRSESMSHHTEEARKYLTAVILELVADLGLKIDGVRLLRKNIRTTDDISAADIDRVEGLVVAHGRHQQGTSGPDQGGRGPGRPA